MYKHAKLKALVTGIAFQSIKGTEAIFSSINDSKNCTYKAKWYRIAALALMIICQRTLVLKHSNSNIIFSDVDQYVPVKLCKIVGNIHLFKILGHLTPDQITLERRLLWDVVQID